MLPPEALTPPEPEFDDRLALQGGRVGKTPPAEKGTLEFLLRRMRHHSDFPALADSVEAINRIASNEKESVERLSGLLLRDFALTNKLLRIVNSPFFMRAGAGSISTVSRAVLVMGFDAVRNIALTVTLFDHLRDRADIQAVMQTSLRAVFSGALARELATGSKEREQAYICALFHQLGRILTRFYLPDEAEAIAAECRLRQCPEDMAAHKILGLSLHELGIGIARNWGLPAAIIDSMRPLPEAIVRKPANHAERMRAYSSIACELSEAIELPPDERREKRLSLIRQRCQRLFDLSHEALDEHLITAASDTVELTRHLSTRLGQTDFGRNVLKISARQHQTPELPASKDATDALAMACLPSSRDDTVEPGNSQDILTAGIQEISNSMVDGFQLNDILRMILETIYRAMAFERVILCIRNPAQKKMQGRFGIGTQAPEFAKAFSFGLDFSADIFHAALTNGADILISDANAPSIASRIPQWFRSLTQANTFILLPLMVRKNAVALIYAEKSVANSIQLNERELALVRTLRNQAVLAIRNAS